MVYYVAYTATNESTIRSQITRQLHVLGCRPIRRAFWVVNDNQIGIVAKLLQKNDPIIMKRRRQIERPCFTKEGTLSELGSLIVIAYKGSKKERTIIDRFLRSAPCIRICRGVYAFSQWHRYFEKGEELVDARRFLTLIREVDQNVVVLPRMIIENRGPIDNLLNVTKQRIENEVEGITEGYKRLLQKMRRNQGERDYVLSTARKLRKRFTTVKKLANFYEKWLRINLSPLLLKPYSPIRQFYALFDEKHDLTVLSSN